MLAGQVYAAERVLSSVGAASLGITGARAENAAPSYIHRAADEQGLLLRDPDWGRSLRVRIVHDLDPNRQQPIAAGMRSGMAWPHGVRLDFLRPQRRIGV